MKKINFWNIADFRNWLSAASFSEITKKLYNQRILSFLSNDSFIAEMFGKSKSYLRQFRSALKIFLAANHAKINKFEISYKKADEKIESAIKRAETVINRIVEKIEKAMQTAGAVLKKAAEQAVISTFATVETVQKNAQKKVKKAKQAPDAMVLSMF